MMELTQNDLFYLNQALNHAKAGRNEALSNPMVGALFLDSHGKLSLARTSQGGRPHAEQNLFSALSDEAKKNGRPLNLQGGSLYVTLEPCAHVGRTPSCAQLWAQLGLKRLVVGLLDQDLRVAGKGINFFKEARVPYIRVLQSDSSQPEEKKLYNELQQFYARYFERRTQQRAFISLKWASSLDGKIALNEGESQWITNPLSRQRTHYLRSLHDSILVGSGTVQRDNPALTVRLSSQTNSAQPIPLILDPDLALEPHYQLFHRQKPMPQPYVFFDQSIPLERQKQYTSSRQCSLIPLLYYKELKTLDLLRLSQWCWSHQIETIFLEGGPKVWSSFYAANLVDHIHHFQAPLYLGSDQHSAFPELRFQSLNHARQRQKLSLISVENLEEDLYTHYEVVYTSKQDIL